eukprot:1762458-Prymnesium_polylepis.1
MARVCPRTVRMLGNHVSQTRCMGVARRALLRPRRGQVSAFRLPSRTLSYTIWPTTGDCTP